MAIKNLYLGTDELVNFDVFATKSDYVSTASLTATLTGYVTTQSQANALANYVTSTALNAALSSYATTASLSNYTTTAGMNAAISAALSGVFTIVPNVAAVNSPGKIYLIKKVSADGANNIYDEYLYIEGKAEFIGTTQLDLSDYAKTSAMTSAIATAKTEAINSAATTAQTKADAAKTAAITAAATDAQSKADAAKTAAISAAASDATTKANNAKSGAVSDAKTYADGKFAQIVKLTQAEYNALPTKDARTMYLIS